MLRSPNQLQSPLILSHQQHDLILASHLQGQHFLYVARQVQSAFVRGYRMELPLAIARQKEADTGIIFTRTVFGRLSP